MAAKICSVNLLACGQSRASNSTFDSYSERYPFEWADGAHPFQDIARNVVLIVVHYVVQTWLDCAERNQMKMRRKSDPATHEKT
jgi:hypothetical protein